MSTIAVESNAVKKERFNLLEWLKELLEKLKPCFSMLSPEAKQAVRELEKHAPDIMDTYQNIPLLQAEQQGIIKCIGDNVDRIEALQLEVNDRQDEKIQSLEECLLKIQQGLVDLKTLQDLHHHQIEGTLDTLFLEIQPLKITDSIITYEKVNGCDFIRLYVLDESNVTHCIQAGFDANGASVCDKLNIGEFDDFDEISKDVVRQHIPTSTINGDVKEFLKTEFFEKYESNEKMQNRANEMFNDYLEQHCEVARDYNEEQKEVKEHEPKESEQDNDGLVLYDSKIHGSSESFNRFAPEEHEQDDNELTKE